MAQFTEQNVLDYRRGGDTIADFAEKYMAEMTRIYQFLNNIRTHNSAGAVQVEPEPYQLKVENNKIYIRNEGNNEWVFLMQVAKNGGFKADTFGKLTSGAASDKPETGVSTYDTYWDTDNGKVYMYLDDAWHLLLSLNVADLTGYNNLVKRDTDVIEPSDTTTVYTTPQKIVQTNDNGVLPVDILGNAGKIAGIKNEVNNLQDGQVLTYRAVSNSWRNEPKGVVGAGASLIINDGETQLAEYSGDEYKEVDVGVTSGITAHNSSANAHANLAHYTATDAHANLAHYTATDAHADLLHLRKAETAYAVGDIAYSALLPSWAYLECTVGGTTSSGDLPVPSSVVVNGTFTDGTVTWMIRKVGFDNEQELATKANRQLSNLDTANLACHVVVDSYYDSTTGNWYRVYDDGWIEQGGLVTGSSSGGYLTGTVNLLKPMKDNKYNITTIGHSNLNGGYQNCVYDVTNTLFTVRNLVSSASGTARWSAAGMGASV